MITAYGTSAGSAGHLPFPPGGGDYETFAGAGSSSVTINHKLLLSGTYTIVIKDYGLNNSGDYAISLAKMPGAVTSPTDTNGGTFVCRPRPSPAPSTWPPTRICFSSAATPTTGY